MREATPFILKILSKVAKMGKKQSINRTNDRIFKAVEKSDIFEGVEKKSIPT